MDRQILGKNIKNRREERGITRTELAKRLNMSPQGISSWENGRTEPRFAMMVKLADVLNCTVPDLLYGPIIEDYRQVDHFIAEEPSITLEEQEFLKAFRNATILSRMLAYKTLLEGKDENGSN